MAIRFVDKDAGDAKPASAKPAPSRAPAMPEAPIADPTAEDAAAPLPGLTHAKPEPKSRGRKKPLSAAASDRPTAADAPPLLDGLLPGLQAHAKPTPKPRGRKKAFG